MQPWRHKIVLPSAMRSAQPVVDDPPGMAPIAGFGAVK
jgi:hypothetical protein